MTQRCNTPRTSDSRSEDRPLIVFSDVTVDGFMAGPGNDLDFLVDDPKPKFREAVPVSEVRHSTAKAVQPMSITTVLAAVLSPRQNDDAPRS